jgi:hypothetical protein
MENRTIAIVSVIVAVALILSVVEYSFIKEQEEQGEEAEGGFFYEYFFKNLFGATKGTKNETVSNITQTNISTAPKEEEGILGRIISRLRGEEDDVTIIAPENAITPEGEFDPEAFRSTVENQTQIPSTPVLVDIGNKTNVALPIPDTVLQGLRELGLEDEFNKFLNLSMGEELNKVFGSALNYTQEAVPYAEQGVVWVGNQTAQTLSSSFSFLSSLFLAFIPIAGEAVSQSIVVAFKISSDILVQLIGLTKAIFAEVIEVVPEFISTVVDSLVKTTLPAINTLVETGTKTISTVFPSMVSSLSRSLPSLSGTGIPSLLSNTITSTLGGVDAVTYAG